VGKQGVMWTSARVATRFAGECFKAEVQK